jgi:hypothetical protein
MASHMTTSFGPLVAQMNEPPYESSLDLTLTQYPSDENPKPQKVHLCLEDKPLGLGIIRFLQILVTR